MNTKRLIVLGIAGVMAIAAALLARGMMGGGTPQVAAKNAPQMPMSDVLIASSVLQPGQALTADQVRWQKWPTSSVDSTFITRDSVASIDDVVKGTVVRSPLASGQPITNAAIIHGNAVGLMAAMLNPGMRAISIPISTDSGAGGFILPNDRIDLILIRKGDANRVSSSTLLTDVRVLAVDQTFKQDKDTKTVIGKTATLEVTPAQAERVAKAQNQGTLSLSLRPLVSSDPSMASNASAPVSHGSSDREEGGDVVSIIRYGISRDSAAIVQGGAKPQ
ncbi:MAG: Flp pilus assembly protein CpaB [Pseudomonadota bacterium]